MILSVTGKQGVPVYREFPTECCCKLLSFGKEYGKIKVNMFWFGMYWFDISESNRFLCWSMRPGHKNVPNY